MLLFRTSVIAALLLLCFAPKIIAQDQQEFSNVKLKMGSRFELMAISVDSTQARQAIDAGYREIDRIEQLISSWIPGSETDQINKAAGIKPVKVSKELFDLISRSIKVSKLTDGAFDISFAGMEKIWEFNRQVVLELPDAQLVASAVKKVNYQNIALDHDESTVFLTNTGMRIGFGSIGKGYAANRAMKVMKDLGIVSGMVNAGGDLITWGQNKA
jgi:thiamine biosynthesis lipoprotein